MERKDDGIFISFKEIEDTCKTLGCITFTVFTVRVLGYIFMPKSFRIDP